MPAKIAVIYYSTYGHVAQLAEKEVEGLKESGAEVNVFQFEETLSDEVRSKMHAGPNSYKYPLITPEDLKAHDGFLMGFPTRYGRTPAQVSAFFDRTGGLWATGGLVGKFAGIFTSTASQHGGQETTALTTYPFFVHHGIITVPIGYAHADLTVLDRVEGGSAYGAATIAGGDGSRQPSKSELDIARFQGKQFGDYVNAFVRGKTALARDAASATAAAPAAGTAAGLQVPSLAPPIDISSLKSTTSAEKGYAVDEAPVKEAGPTAAVAPAPASAPVVKSETPAPAPAPAAAAPVTPAPVAEKPVVPITAPTSTAKPAAAPAVQQKKKKGGVVCDVLWG